MNPSTRTIAVVVGVIIVLALAGVGVWYFTRNAGNQTDDANNGANVESNPNQITISNFAFVPGELTVKTGTEVTWVNDDSASHQITSGTPGGADAGDAFSSQVFGRGQNYSHTFDVEGVYPYFCSIHSSMTGTITVTK